MKSKPLAVGDPIEAWCTKCRLTTNHIIVALPNSKPKKVQCNTCRGEHIYRKPKSQVQTELQKAAKLKLSEQKKWSELEDQIKNEKCSPYSMDGVYKVGGFIRHPQFGIGLIQGMTGIRKMEVLFETGVKIMRCK